MNAATNSANNRYGMRTLVPTTQPLYMPESPCRGPDPGGGGRLVPRRPVRHPQPRISPLLPESLPERAVDVAETLEAKLAAYTTTQLGFLLGGEENTREAFAAFAAGRPGMGARR